MKRPTFCKDKFLFYFSGSEIYSSFSSILTLEERIDLYLKLEETGEKMMMRL